MDVVGFVRRQVAAGRELICESGLVQWHDAPNFLAPASEVEFEHRVSRTPYARLRAWLLFSVGSEYVIKGVCAYHGIPAPNGRTEAEYLARDTLGAYVSGSSPRLCLIAPKLGLCPEVLTKPCKRLKAIRDRDVHRYVHDVRQAEFPALGDSILPMLNTLLVSLPPQELQNEQDRR
jgi:hypothetical protein